MLEGRLTDAKAEISSGLKERVHTLELQLNKTQGDFQGLTEEFERTRQEGGLAKATLSAQLEAARKTQQIAQEEAGAAAAEELRELSEQVAVLTEKLAAKDELIKLTKQKVKILEKGSSTGSSTGKRPARSSQNRKDDRSLKTHDTKKLSSSGHRVRPASGRVKGARDRNGIKL